jgi:hypothetical protein
MYLQSNVWAPGGSTPLALASGHSLIIVKAGTVTEYEGHDPDCKPHVYETGMAFVDPGGDHTRGLIQIRTLHIISPRRTPSRSRLVNVMARVYCRGTPLCLTWMVRRVHLCIAFLSSSTLAATVFVDGLSGP